jgi:ketosteroid isomerase-like protein
MRANCGFTRNQTNHKSMKIIISFFVTLLLAAVSFAQEESASPATESTPPASEEKASANVEEAPPAKPMESTAPAVTAEKKAEPAASPKAAATAAAKKEATTANAAKPASAAAPAKVNTKNMAPRDAEIAWEAAISKHDTATIDGFIAADFSGVSSKNKFIGRSDVLSEIKGDKDTYKTAKNERLNVKMYGKDVAVVTGRAREAGTGKDGKAFDRTYLFTDTWMMRGGKWQCIASQVTKIKG